MRIPILSVKGGVGKSTVSLLLASELSLMGEKVILLDRDQVGFSSSLAGIEEKGLVASVVDNEATKPVSRLKIGKGEIFVVKFYGDGPRFESDLHVIKSDSQLVNELKARYSSILRSIKHSHIIIDNSALSIPNEVGNRIELETYLSMFPGSVSFRLLVSDIALHNLDNTIRYVKALDIHLRETSARAVGQCIIINMTPPGWRYVDSLPVLRDKMTEGNISCGVILPFFDELFQYMGEIDEMPRLKQIQWLAERFAENVIPQGIVE